MKFLHLIGKDKEKVRRKEELLDGITPFIARQNLSTIPSMFAKISELNRNPSASASDFARVYEMDQAACMRLLVLANSVYYGTRTGASIRNVEEAIVRVGMNRAREIINSAMVSALFKRDMPIADYSASDLWMNSVAVAVCNRILYAKCAPPVEQPTLDPYLAGLLHNIGISIGHQCLFNRGFQTALEERAKNDSLLADEEERHVGITHNEIGMFIALKWNFPAELNAVIGHHHDLNASEPEHAWLIHATRVSLWLALENKLGYSDFPGSLAAEYADSCRFIGAGEHTITSASKQTVDEITRLKALGWFVSVHLHKM